MNILITSIGRRVKLAQYFKMELAKIEGSLITSDLDCNAPALYFSEFNYTISQIFSDSYVEELIEICKKHNISAVLTLIDPELEILAANEERFAKEKIKIIVSELETIKMSFDKFEAHNFLSNKGLYVVPTFIDKQILLTKVHTGEFEFPLILKPRSGSASKGFALVNNASVLEAIDNSKKELVFQPYFKDKEFGIDVYIDLITGKLVNLFIKEKMLMRSGETDKSISVHNERIESLIIKLIQKTNFRGPIDVDVFEYKGEFYISEINPRFGGGYPHAFECGVNFPQYIINNIQGHANEEYSGFTYAEGKVMMKYDDLLVR
ncbi:ATP-grasp domain-containing protein [Sporosarcina sp. CAU 1771]